MCQECVGGAPSSSVPVTVLLVASARAECKLLSVASSPTSQRTVAAVPALDDFPSRLPGYLCAFRFCAWSLSPGCADLIRTPDDPEPEGNGAYLVGPWTIPPLWCLAQLSAGMGITACAH